MTVIKSLVWDDWNIDHIARHNVKPEEVEWVCKQKKALINKVSGGKVRIIGQAISGQYLTVFLAHRGQQRYYVVTARGATDREKRFYRKRSK